MAVKYWVANGVAAADANTDANWNSAADGLGSTGKPAGGDTAVFGDATTIANNKGFAPCNWNYATIGGVPQIKEVHVNDAYGDVVSIQTDHVQFVATGSKITLGDNQSWDDFKVGMGILINGTDRNDGTYEIATIGTGATANTITVTTSLIDETYVVADEIGIGISSIERTITLAENMYVQALRLGCRLDAASAKSVVFSGAIVSSSDYNSADYSNRYVLNGDNAGFYNISNITYSIDGASWSSTGTRLHFDTGPHPIVTCSTATYFSPQYKTPTSANFGETTSIYKLQITNTTASLMAPVSTVNAAGNDSKKIFLLQAGTTDQLDYNPDDWDAGLSTWGFTARTGGFEIPVTGSTTYGNGNFSAKWYGIIVLASTTPGDLCFISTGKKLYCNNLTIAPNTLLKGSLLGSNENDIIQMVKKPVILGSWNFVRVSEGIYHSNPQLNNGYYDNLEIKDKLTVGGLIDPTGMVFTPQAANPESTNPQDTIWIDSETNHLFRGERDTESTVHFNVRNDEGATIPVGAPLYSKGEIGGSNRIKVGIADASDANKMPAIGLAMEEMNTTSTKDGNMILTGIFNENITITSVAEQDIIYVAPHGGSAPYLTITRPTSASHLVQNVGVCVRQSATNVSQGMKVAAIGRTNDSPNCSFLMANTESTHPQSRRLVAGTNITLTDGGAGGDLTIAASGAVSAVANGADNRVATFSSADALNGEANLTFDGSTLALTGDFNVGSGDFFVDDSTGRVGIGTTSPDTALHLQDSSGDKPILTLETTSTSASAEPSLTFDRSTGSGGGGAIADGDNIGQVIFKSRNDAGTPEEINYMRILGEVNDVTDGTEDGRLFLYMMKGGSEVEYLRLAPTQILFNNSGADIDFIVEGDTATNLLYANAGNDNVGINTSPESSTRFHVEDDGSKSFTLLLESTDTDANNGPTMALWRNSASPANGDDCGGINWYFENDAGARHLLGRLRSEVNEVTSGSEDSRLYFSVFKAGSEVETVSMKHDEVVINDGSNDIDLRVEGDTDANLLVCDAGTDAVKIAGATSSKVGFYGTAPTVQQGTIPAVTPLLSPGATPDDNVIAATVDQIISALQTLGLIA